MPTNKKFLKKQDHKGYHYDHNSFQEYLLPSKTWKEEKVLFLVCVWVFFWGGGNMASETWEGLLPLSYYANLKPQSGFKNSGSRFHIRT